jgi:hypothetical protein
MSTIPNLLISRTSGAFNKLQQELSDGSLQNISKQLESQFPQLVNDSTAGWSDSNPPQETQKPPLMFPPAYAYYGYGRPFPTPQQQWDLSVIQPLPVPYVVPIGYINRGQAQTGPALYPPYS